MKNTLVLLFSALLISSCGGGGGGSSTVLATTFLQVEPTTVEVGGNQSIRLELRDVTDNLSIKLRYPEALSYVDTSARFISAEAEVITNPAADVSEDTSTPDPTTTPTATPTVAASGTASQSASDNYDKHYLVFYISRDAFGADDAGVLTLKLRAKDVLDSAKIELDIDLDDPSISNNSEFSVSNPQFEAEEHLGIRIRN